MSLGKCQQKSPVDAGGNTDENGASSGLQVTNAVLIYSPQTGLWRKGILMKHIYWFWVRFPFPARPTLSVEKLLFSVTLLRGTFSITAIEIIKWVKNFAVAKVC
jgi:hypothetical protein